MTDADLPIIDAHHHFWDPVRNYHPWLRDEPMIPFRYGDYSSIRGRYLPVDYAYDAQRHNVVAHVTMEGEWDEATPVEESAWMSEIADVYPRLSGHVARAFLDRDDVAEVLEGHARYPLVRAIRHKPVASPSPGHVAHGTPGSMSDPAWQRGYAMLRRHGLHFELQAPWWHVDELLDLCARFPETPVVLNHCFMPVDRSAEGLAGWRAAVFKAASVPSMTMKISGIGIRGRNWSLDDQRAVIDACIEAFGPDRAMFASNFPVDRLVGTFDAIVSGFKSATANLPANDRLRLFHDTAVRVYRLPLAPLAA
ncbi:MAG: amidohydrolase family protein [Hyphomicrobiaceae bacterium]